MGSFLTLASTSEAELKVVGSRFIAWAAGVESEEEAREALAGRGKTFFDATHNCAAWRLRNGGWRCVDDGEPAGSAGASILAAIDGAGLSDVIVVVTRYFGGTRLGVGGLARAYRDSAALAMDLATRRIGRSGYRVLIGHPYELTGVVMRCSDRLRPGAVDHSFLEDRAETTLIIRSEDLELMTSLLREETAGLVAPEVIGETVFYQAEAVDSGLARE